MGSAAHGGGGGLIGKGPGLSKSSGSAYRMDGWTPILDGMVWDMHGTVINILRSTNLNCTSAYRVCRSPRYIRGLGWNPHSPKDTWDTVEYSPQAGCMHPTGMLPCQPDFIERKITHGNLDMKLLKTKLKRDLFSLVNINRTNILIGNY